DLTNRRNPDPSAIVLEQRKLPNWFAWELVSSRDDQVSVLPPIQACFRAKPHASIRRRKERLGKRGQPRADRQCRQRKYTKAIDPCRRDDPDAAFTVLEQVQDEIT